MSTDFRNNSLSENGITDNNILSSIELLYEAFKRIDICNSGYPLVSDIRDSFYYDKRVQSIFGLRRIEPVTISYKNRDFHIFGGNTHFNYFKKKGNIYSSLMQNITDYLTKFTIFEDLINGPKNMNKKVENVSFMSIPKSKWWKIKLFWNKLQNQILTSLTTCQQDKIQLDDASFHKLRAIQESINAYEKLHCVKKFTSSREEITMNFTEYISVFRKFLNRGEWKFKKDIYGTDNTLKKPEIINNSFKDKLVRDSILGTNITQFETTLNEFSYIPITMEMELLSGSISTKNKPFMLNTHIKMNRNKEINLFKDNRSKNLVDNEYLYRKYEKRKWSQLQQEYANLSMKLSCFYDKVLGETINDSICLNNYHLSISLSEKKLIEDITNGDSTFPDTNTFPHHLKGELSSGVL